MRRALAALAAGLCLIAVGAGEDYGGAAAEWKPSLKARGFNLQGMRRAGPNAGFKEEHFKWMKEWGEFGKLLANALSNV